MPRFVILRHEPAPDTPQRLHWDFMLEAEQVLRTWALAERPSPGVRICATRLPDHRLVYLDYEGPVSANRGCVRRWDQGSYEVVNDSPSQTTVRLAGEQIHAIAMLTRAADDSRLWTFELQPHP